MGRDDLKIYGNEKLGNNNNDQAAMPQIELQDCATVLDEFVNRTANLPNEITFMQDEIREKDIEMKVCIGVIERHDASIQKWIRINGSHVPNPKEDSLRKLILEAYDKAEILQAEKIALAQKTQIILDKHTRWLDGHIKSLQERNEFPNDPELPSLLRPQVHDRPARVESSAAAMPLGQITANSATVPRHPNQHPARMLPAQVQAHQLVGTSASSAPATPAASLLMNRQVRESSLGAASSKRQRLAGGLGTLPATSSNLARHSSLTPNTPRAGTPGAGAGTRAGSAGPRAAQKTTASSKKIAPTGSRQSGMPRKAKPGKSNLSRIKRIANKNSPSSTNDSELSDAESGTADEDDEPITPPAAKDADGDDDMADIDDDEGGDDKKYCMCQSVSYGDMVACDNESCPYEWFHWTCVGLKSEPVGTWICPICTKNMKK
jgi:inhibitor of growth protein 3